MLIIVIIILFIIALKFYLLNLKKSSDNISDSPSTVDDSCFHCNFESIKTVAIQPPSQSCDNVISSTSSAKKFSLSHNVRYCTYKVRGKNPATNRQKTCYVLARDNADNDVIFSKTSFLPPYTVELADRPPTEGQLQYAREHSLSLPASCTADDAAQISHGFPSITKLVSPDLIIFAGEQQIFISPYADVVYAVSATHYYLDSPDSLAFLIYVIYCVLNDYEIGNLDTLPNRLFFYGMSDDNDMITFSDTFRTNWLEHFFIHKSFDWHGNRKRIDNYNRICNYLKLVE